MRTIPWLIFCLLSFLLNAEAMGQNYLDPAFGNQGKLRLRGSDFNALIEMEPDANGNLVVLAHTGEWVTDFDMDVLLIRLDSLGNPDNTFGQNGFLRFDFGNRDYSEARALEILPDGRLMVLGSAWNFGQTDEVPVCMARFWADGTPDSTFGANGFHEFYFLSPREFPQFLKADTGNGWLVGGGTLDTAHAHAVTPVVARLNADGTPDSSFGGTGKLLFEADSLIFPFKTTHQTGGQLWDALRLPDGAVLVAGGASDGDHHDPFFAKIKPDGTPDSTFGLNGFARMYISLAANSQITGMERLPDGRIWFSATIIEASGRDFHYGFLDPQTGGFGNYSVEFNGQEDILEDFILLNDGSLIATGRTIDPANNSVVAVSDRFAFCWWPDAASSFGKVQAEVEFDTGFEDGAYEICQLTNGRIIAGGVVHTDSVGVIELAFMALDLHAVGVENALQESLFSVYPNPTNGLIQLQGAENALLLEVLQSDGRFVMRQTLDADQQVDLSGLSPDLYWIRIYFRDAPPLSAKVIVARH